MNGIQAMTGCSGPLVVRARGANDGVNLIIEVEDCGCGITPEALPRIFDPFFSTKDVDRGTGLGLYVTYGIIKKHNGNIVASSTPGAGTKFAITIPMKHVSETQ
jgi:signal transduction histidine kinase